MKIEPSGVVLYPLKKNAATKPREPRSKRLQPAVLRRSPDSPPRYIGRRQNIEHQKQNDPAYSAYTPSSLTQTSRIKARSRKKQDRIWTIDPHITPFALPAASPKTKPYRYLVKPLTRKQKIRPRVGP